MKNETIEHLRYRVKTAHAFIRALHKSAENYGSNFSSEVAVDCEAFFRDNPAPKKSTHVVITKTYLRRLQKCALERLQLKAALRRAEKRPDIGRMEYTGPQP